MATVIPYTNNVTNVTSLVKSASPVLPHKPPLTLQESGIFEEEYEDEEESEIEFASRGTQTQAPSGELLQEVQRLQELRTWIQERAAKNTTPVFHPIDSSKICLDMSTMDSIVQLTAYQERVRDLEERLQVHEEAEKSREQEKRASKQREEEFLDENYRLTERIYWLENELRNVRTSLDEISGDAGRTEAILTKRSRRTGEGQDSEDTGDSANARDQVDSASCTARTAKMCVVGNVVAGYQHQQADARQPGITAPMECNVTVRNVLNRCLIRGRNKRNPVFSESIHIVLSRVFYSSCPWRGRRRKTRWGLVNPGVNRSLLTLPRTTRKRRLGQGGLRVTRAKYDPRQRRMSA